MSVNIDRRRASSSAFSSTSQWWISTEITAIQNAITHNQRIARDLSLERQVLTPANNRLIAILAEHSTLSNDIKAKHEVVDLKRFSGNRQTEFKAKLEPLKQRVTSLITDTTTNSETISARIDTVTNLGNEIRVLANAQRDDIGRLQGRINYLDSRDYEEANNVHP